MTFFLKGSRKKVGKLMYDISIVSKGVHIEENSSLAWVAFLASYTPHVQFSGNSVQIIFRWDTTLTHSHKHIKKPIS